MPPANAHFILASQRVPRLSKGVGNNMVHPAKSFFGKRPAQWSRNMSRYLTMASYTSEAMARMVNHPEDRGAVLRELIERLGGEVITFDFCFGEYHVVMIVEFPDDETMEAISMAIYASGAITDFKVTVLIPMEDALRAMRRAQASGYHPPGD